MSAVLCLRSPFEVTKRALTVCLAGCVPFPYLWSISRAGDVREEHHGPRAPDLLLRSLLCEFLLWKITTTTILVSISRPLGSVHPLTGAGSWKCLQRCSRGSTHSRYLFTLTIHKQRLDLLSFDHACIVPCLPFFLHFVWRQDGFDLACACVTYVSPVKLRFGGFDRWACLGAKQLAVSLLPEKVLVHGNLRRKGVGSCQSQPLSDDED